MKLQFEPGKWHSCDPADWRECDRNANCYAYVLDRSDYYWAVPGTGFARTKAPHYYESFDAYFQGVSPADFQKQLISGAVEDGLLPVDKPEHRPGYYLVALFFPDISEGLDFHWYRQDDDGTWSHKDGWHAPSNTDAQGNMIHDPRNIAGSGYPIFGGFFLVLREGMTLRQNFPLTQK